MQSLIECGSIQKHLCKPSPTARVHINVRILPNSPSYFLHVMQARVLFSVSQVIKIVGARAGGVDIKDSLILCDII